MRILVTWGTKRGGTEGIARIVGETLRKEGFEVTLLPASEAHDVSGYDAAIVGGALYMNRWHADSRRFVDRNVATLRRMPVWLFSSGPLDDSADRKEIPPPTQVAVLGERIGALGHTTFGGRLIPDAKGFPASAMAKTTSGDWRNSERIAAWTRDVAKALPQALPGVAVDPPARAAWRVPAYGVAGWAACAAVWVGLQIVAPFGVATALHALTAPLIFTAVAVGYFRPRGPREPLPTALAFTGLVALLDAVVVGALFQGDLGMFTSIAATWLPYALVLLVTWCTGLVLSTMPWPKPQDTAQPAV